MLCVCVGENRVYRVGEVIAVGFIFRFRYMSFLFMPLF